MAYPIGVTRSLGTWKFNSNYVERILDNAAYDSVHADDSLILAGPARRGVAVPGRNNARTLFPLGMMQTFSVQQSAPLIPQSAIGSARSFFLRGKPQTQFSFQRTMLNGRNMLRAIYHNAMEVSGLDVSKFDDPAALARDSQFFTNLDSELYTIPVGFGVILRTKSRTLVGSCYIELAYINSWGFGIQAGAGIVGESCSGMADRIVPWQVSDAIAGIATNGRAAMDAVLGLAPNVFPIPNTATIARFTDDGLADGTVESL
jgi:hypothetical protein